MGLKSLAGVIRESGAGMTGRRTGVYQPARAVQEYDPLHPDNGDPGNSRLPRFIVAALLGLAALAIMVWFGYSAGIDRGKGEVIVIGPPPGPVRTRPDQPGGAPPLYTGLKVYEQPQAPQVEAEASHLSPASSSEELLPGANQTSGASSDDVPAVPAAAPAEHGIGPGFVQIGAYPSRDFADKAFRQFKLAHGDLAGDYLPDIEKADLGTKGIWYRLRLGPFAGKGAAAAACERMKKEGVTCLIAGR